MVAAFGSIWVRSQDGTNIIREIDPSTDKIVGSLHVGSPGDARMAVGMRSIWVLDGRGELFRIDSRNGGRVIASIPVAPSAYALAVGDGAVWVGGTCCGSDAQPGAGGLYRMDPATNQVAAGYPLPGPPGSIAIGSAGLWATDYVGALGAVVLHVDPRDGHVLATIKLGTHTSLADVVSDGAGGWTYVTARNGFAGNRGGVFQINPRTNEITRRITVPGALMGVAVSMGDVWVNSGPLVLVQPFAGNVVATVPVSAPDDTNAGIAMIGRVAWLSDPVDQQVVRVVPKTGACPPHTGAYVPTMSRASGAPGTRVTIPGALPAYSVTGEYRPRTIDEVEFWWNLSPNKWYSALPGSTPVPARPGPVVALGAQGVLGMCAFRVTFTVPRVARGVFPVEGIYFGGRFAAGFGPQPFQASFGPIMFHVTAN
jgi:hypothetical protein